MVAQAVECTASDHRVNGSNFDFYKKIHFFSLNILIEISNTCSLGDGHQRLSRKMDMQHETGLTFPNLR